MPKHYTVVEDKEPTFPKAKVITQYDSPIGPTQEGKAVPTEQYKKPIGPKKDSIFKRVARVAAPGLTGEAEALGKKGVAKLVGGAVISGVRGAGERVGYLTEHMGAPVWLQDIQSSRKGKKKSTQITGHDLPAWVFGGGMPWDSPKKSTDVEKIIVTRVHSDGTRTTTTRMPSQKPRSNKPDWINY
jgi:hypothetical protein